LFAKRHEAFLQSTFTSQLKLKNVIIFLVSSLSVKAVSLWDYVFGLRGLALRQGGFNIKTTL